MRATWPGAKTGRITMLTGPWEVSSSNVLSRVSDASVMRIFCFLFLARFDDRENERAPRNGAAKFLGYGERRATVQHVDDRALIGRPDLRRHAGRRKSETRLAQDLAVPGEG